MKLLWSLKYPCLRKERQADEWLLKDTFLYCKEIRAHYALLQMVWTLCFLDQLSSQVIADVQ